MKVKTGMISPHPDTSIPVKDAIKRLSVASAPWLVDVSDDGSVWTIQDGSGAKRKTAIIDFNWVFPDGSRLTDKKNASFYEMALSYAWVFRLYCPDVSASIHAGRVSALITFFYWLRLLNVRSLSSVTTDHFDLFAEKIALGKEWTLEAPQRLHKHLQKALSDNTKLPRPPRYKNILKRNPIYQSAGVDWYGSGRTAMALSICSSILEWLEANGLEDAELLPLEDIMKAQNIELSAQTVQAVHRALMPIEELWIWRHQLPHENIKIVPFFLGASKKASQLGIESKRHPTIPPKLAISYLTGALTWVLDYSTIILEEVADTTQINVTQLTKRLNDAGLDITIAERCTSSIDSRKINVTRLVEVFSAACFAVIASLTARRLEEIVDLGAGCADEPDADGNYWLKIYIEKTSQRYDQIPIPIAVKKAIESMEKISKSARERSGNDSIWQVLINDVRQITPDDYLNDLAALNGTLVSANTEWNFTAHQFRRFFAILYFWRYEKGDLAALSHHLRHFNLEMTKRYVTDVEMGKIWKEVEAEWQADFLRGVIDGSRTVGGKAGTRLMREASKLMTHFRKSVDVIAPQRVVQYLQRLAQKLGSEFRQHVWGTICACPQNTKFSEHAECKGAARTGPVFKNANEALCAACPFAIHTERFAEQAAKGLESRRATISSCNEDTILSELANIQIVSLEKLLSSAEAMPSLPEEADG